MTTPTTCAQPRRRATFLSVTQMFNLTLACQPLHHAGWTAYLVGSCLSRSDYRDVDLRTILADEDYDAIFQGCPMRALFLSTAVSEWLTVRTALPIDFQFQRRSDANAEFPGERHAMFMR